MRDKNAVSRTGMVHQKCDHCGAVWSHFAGSAGFNYCPQCGWRFEE